MPFTAALAVCSLVACGTAPAPSASPVVAPSLEAASIGNAIAASNAAGLTRADRPRDPWVFRTVLDGEARMVVVALSKDLWLAYDAGNGELAKAWDGDVVFQGAVHDAVHGPQPTSRGEPRLGRASVPPAPDAPPKPAGSVTGLPGDRPEPAFAALEPERAPERPSPFRLLVEGRPVDADYRWLGYVLRDDGVVLRSALVVDGRTMAVIEEAPEVLEVHDGRIPLVRSIVLRETAPQVDVELRLPDRDPGLRLGEPERLDWRVRGGALRNAGDEPDVRIVRLARAGATVLRLDLPVE